MDEAMKCGTMTVDSKVYVDWRGEERLNKYVGTSANPICLGEQRDIWEVKTKLGWHQLKHVQYN